MFTRASIKQLTAVLLASLMAGAALQAQRPGSPGTSNHGFARDRLGRIDRWLQSYVDSNRIAGAVLLVMRDGAVVYEKAVGWSDREAGRRMTTDALFRIASQSKALTSVAAMMLLEEGKLSLADPVSRFIPAFARTTVMTAT